MRYFLVLLLVTIRLSATPFFWGQAHSTSVTNDAFPVIAGPADIAAYDPTKQAFETNITVITPGRYAIGVATPLAGSGKTLRYKTNGVLVTTQTIDYSNLANVASTYAEGGIIVALVAGVYTVRVEIGTTINTIEGVIVRKPDLNSGIVEDQGSGQHCSPLSSVYSNQTYRVYAEMYSADVYLSIEGIAKGKILNGAAVNEHYHNGCAVLAIPGGVIAAQVGHNTPKIQFVFLPNGDFTAISPARTLGAAISDYTYCQMRYSTNTGYVHILTRGSNEDTTSHGIIHMTLTNPTNLVASVATGTIDVLATDGDPYPRYISVEDNGSGTEAIIFGWNERDIGVAWETISACIFAPASGAFGKYYSLKGDEATVQTALGTNGAPRFNTQMQTNVTSIAAGINIMTRISTYTVSGGPHYGQRYGVEALVGKILTFPVAGATPHGELFGLYVDNGANGENSYALSSLRYFQQIDTNRTLSPYQFLEPTQYIPDPNSYRVAGTMFWQDENNTGTNIALVLTDRGTRLATNRYGEQIDLYYDWGGTNLDCFQIQNPFGSPTFKYMSQSPAVGVSTANGLTKVYGLTNVIEYETSDNVLHPTHAQSHRVQLQWMDTGGVTNTIASGWHYYKNISITNNNNALTNFPVYLSFSGDTDIGGRANVSGNNIRFTKSDGTTLLNYQRRSFNIAFGAATGTFVIATDLAASGVTTIRIWYDNSSASDGSSTVDKVYDSGYTLVAGLGQDPSGSAPQMTDYSAIGNNGTVNGAMTATNSVTGLAGNALYFKGDGFQWVDFGSMLLSRDRFGEEVESLSFESFVNFPSAVLARDAIIVSKGELSSGTTAGSFSVWRDDVGVSRNNTYAAIFRGKSNSTTVRIEGADGAANTALVWQGVGVTFAANQTNGIRLYINGVEDANSPASSANVIALKGTNISLTLGKQGTATNTLWQGMIDETRLSFYPRDSNWVNQTYHNIADTSHLVSFGPEIFQ